MTALAERIAPLVGQIEAERRLPAAVVQALVDAGVFKLCVPRAYGGAQASAAELVAAIEDLARIDGSVGWCAMIGATSGLMSVYVDDATARAMFEPPDAVACGVFAPMGRAVPVDGGYRVTGRWPFASGCEHARWRMGGTIVVSDPPQLLPSGAPDVRCCIFKSDDTTIHDTWDVAGLRGTGSHDISVKDVFVPRERTFSLFTDTPRFGYTMPFFGVLAAGVAAVGLGIARAAIESAMALARAKTPPGSKRTLAHRELVQLEVARAEGRVRAARAGLHAALGEAVATDVVSRARLRIAACHAATEAAAATSAMYELGGGSAVYATSPLQRQFRDAHVVTHHLMVSATSLTMAGRVLLGVASETDLL